MTAINVLLQRERGWLVTDAAWYGEDGVVHHFGPKSQVVGHWPGAIATRGPGLANSAIAMEAGLLFPDFDAFAEGASDFLRGWCERNAGHLDAWDPLAGHVEVIAVGWSKSCGRPRAVIISTLDDAAAMASHGGDDRSHRATAFEPFEISTGYMRPQPSPEGMAAVRLDPDIDLDALEVLSGVGTRIVAAQRMLREQLVTDGEPVCVVGGYVMITRVDRDGVHMCKGAAFPDVVGQLIEARPDDIYWPHDDAPETSPAGPPPGLNRQQRRIWEAEQRKRGGGAVRAVR